MATGLTLDSGGLIVAEKRDRRLLVWPLAKLFISRLTVCVIGELEAFVLREVAATRSR